MSDGVDMESPHLRQKKEEASRLSSQIVRGRGRVELYTFIRHGSISSCWMAWIVVH